MNVVSSPCRMFRNKLMHPPASPSKRRFQSAPFRSIHNLTLRSFTHARTCTCTHTHTHTCANSNTQTHSVLPLEQKRHASTWQLLPVVFPGVLWLAMHVSHVLASACMLMPLPSIAASLLLSKPQHLLLIFSFPYPPPPSTP